MKRHELIEQVATVIAEIEIGHPVRVAIDGADAAGKTTFADELIVPIKRCGRPVIRVTLDRFHNPRAIRYFRGRHSPEGYYRDSFNYDALIGNVLEPLGPGGSRQYRPAAFDYKTDEPVISPQFRAADDAVLLVDGIFLQRSELREYFDFTIFLDVRFEISTERMAARDGIAADNRRYVEGQRIYFSECRPQSLARIVIDNNDLANPVLSFNVDRI